MPPSIIDFKGLPAVRHALPQGDACVVALQGGQLLSWTTADGIERIYLSPSAILDGRTPIRGGIPVCWPQFNARGTLPKHGFARTSTWALDLAGEAAPGIDAAASGGDDAKAHGLRLTLADSDTTRSIWPHGFLLTLDVRLAPGSLQVVLGVDNTGHDTLSFAAALHTYLRVDAIAQAELLGLHGARRWDAVRDLHQVELSEALRFEGEFDSVYAAPADGIVLRQAAGRLRITQSASFTEAVVWNPGADLAARLSDLPDDGWPHMLCVEAARIDRNVMLEPGARWLGWQRIEVL
ncbi:MAG: D-hexose-6-phosphate mutarotase [Comamonadaceae bacterium]|nr:MAG: D-hexose-6-phosphate mutarotase [Comamonadaceae bacterium]